jgi:hypothetical protein
MATQPLRNDNDDHKPAIARVIDRMLSMRQNGSCNINPWFSSSHSSSSSSGSASAAVAGERTATGATCRGWTGVKSSTSPVIPPPPRFHETESSSDDSDGSSSKGRRRFRLGRKRQSCWKNLTRTSRDSQHSSPYSRIQRSTTGLVVEKMVEEVALQSLHFCGASEVSSLSCLEVCSDEELLDFCSDDDCSINSEEGSTNMVEITNSTLLLQNDELRYGMNAKNECYLPC